MQPSNRIGRVLFYYFFERNEPLLEIKLISIEYWQIQSWKLASFHGFIQWLYHSVNASDRVTHFKSRSSSKRHLNEATIISTRINTVPTIHAKLVVLTQRWNHVVTFLFWHHFLHIMLLLLLDGSQWSGLPSFLRSELYIMQLLVTAMSLSSRSWFNSASDATCILSISAYDSTRLFSISASSAANLLRSSNAARSAIWSIERHKAADRLLEKADTSDMAQSSGSLRLSHTHDIISSPHDTGAAALSRLSSMRTQLFVNICQSQVRTELNFYSNVTYIRHKVFFFTKFLHSNFMQILCKFH